MRIIRILLSLALAFCYTDSIFSAGPYIKTVSFQGSSGRLSDPQNKNIEILAFEELDKISLIGKITAVMNYSNGQLVSTKSRDGSIEIIDANGYRGNIQKIDSNSSGQYAYTRFRVYGVDIKSIINAGGLAEYLRLVGFTDSQIALLSTTDINGDLNTKGLDTALSWLCADAKNPDTVNINVSVQIDFGSYDGTARFTKILNGQPLQVIGANAKILEESVYDGNGQLKQDVKYIYTTSGAKIPVTDKDGNPVFDEETGNPIFLKDENGNYIYEQMLTKRIIKYNESGQLAGDYQEVLDITNPNNQTIEKNITKIISYVYKSGTIYSSTDLTSGEITYYTNGGIASYIVDKNGIIKTKFNYSPAGILSSEVSYSNGKQINITVYDENGQMVASSATDEDKDVIIEQVSKIKNAISGSINRNIDAAAQDIEQAIFQSDITSMVLRYNDLITYPALMRVAILGTSDTDVDKGKNLKETEWGKFKPEFDKVKSIEQAVKNLADKEKKLSASDKTFTSVQMLFDYLKNVGRGAFLIERGQAVTNKYDGKSVLQTDSFSGAQVRTTANTQEVYPDLTFNLRFPQNNRAVTFTNRRILSNALNSRTVNRTYYAYNTIMEGRVTGFFDKEGNNVNLDAEDIIAGGGVVYVSIRTARLNMFDTKGFFNFTKGDGDEYLYLRIGNESKEDIAGSLKIFNDFRNYMFNGSQVMISGVVTDGISNNMEMTMIMNTNQSSIPNGYSTNISTVEGNINNDAKRANTWAGKNTITNHKIFKQAGLLGDDGYLKAWKDGFSYLAGLFNTQQDK